MSRTVNITLKYCHGKQPSKIQKHLLYDTIDYLSTRQSTVMHKSLFKAKSIAQRNQFDSCIPTQYQKLI
jgi:hypothetical protein